MIVINDRQFSGYANCFNSYNAAKERDRGTESTTRWISSANWIIQSADNTDASVRTRPGHIVAEDCCRSFRNDFTPRRIIAFKNKDTRHCSKITATSRWKRTTTMTTPTTTTTKNVQTKSTDLHRYFANVSYIPVDWGYVNSFRLCKEIRFVFFFQVVNFSGQRREISIP